MRAALTLLAVLCAAGPASAQTLDAASQRALAETLTVLRDSALRDPAIARNPEAVGIDRQIQAMAGSRELAGGDVRRMSESLERGRTDPATFAALLSPSTLARLRAIAARSSDPPR